MVKKTKVIVSTTLSITLLAGFSNMLLADEAAFPAEESEYAAEAADTIEYYAGDDTEEEIEEETEYNEIAVSLAPGAVTLGDYGDDVAEIQLLLAKYGYYNEVIDGDFGNITYNAVLAFQEKNGLLVDGIVGSITLGALYGNPVTANDVAAEPSETPSTEKPTGTGSAISQVLFYGSYGDEVITLQNALTALGYNVGIIDGDFGSMTEAGVMAFQSDYGLVVDGIFGPVSLGKLNSLQGGSGAADSGSEKPAGTDNSQSSAGSIAYGAQGDAVASIQQILLYAGYPINVVDGDFGPNTQSAVEIFQFYNNIPKTGIVDSGTLALLNSGNFTAYRVLGEGFTGEDVTLVQTILSKLNYLDCEPTGYFGSLTAAALTEFQKDYGLSITGSLNYESLMALSSVTIGVGEEKPEEKPADKPENSGTASTIPANASLGEQIVAYAQQWVEKTPYVSYGDRVTVDEDGVYNSNSSLITGTDCSGFTQLIYEYFDIYVPASSVSYQENVGTQITYAELMPGDIVVYRYGGHVAIYAGKDEDGNDMIIHCANEELGTIRSSMFYQEPTAYVRVVS